MLTCSAATDVGLDEVWAQIEQHRAVMSAAGELDERRARQQVQWLWSTVEERLVSEFRRRDDVREQAAEFEQQLRAGTITPTLAARRLLDLAAHVTRTSRLACQIVLTADLDTLTVRMPGAAHNLDR